MLNFAVDMLREGFFEKYFISPFFRHYADFTGSASRNDVLYSGVAWLTVTVGLAGVLIGLVGLLGPEVGFVTSIVVGILWIAGSACPFAALFRRLSNSENSDEESGMRKPVFLFIDKAFIAVCGLFLIFGILMMVVTLNSGDINMNPRGSGDYGPNPILEGDSVVEEPIFTYQSEDVEEEHVDTLNDLSDLDTVSLDESFDPTLNPTAPEDPDTLSMEY